MVGIGF